jgi:hypothetical protein
MGAFESFGWSRGSLLDVGPPPAIYGRTPPAGRASGVRVGRRGRALTGAAQRDAGSPSWSALAAFCRGNVSGAAEFGATDVSVIPLKAGCRGDPLLKPARACRADKSRSLRRPRKGRPPRRGAGPCVHVRSSRMSPLRLQPGLPRGGAGLCPVTARKVVEFLLLIDRCNVFCRRRRPREDRKSSRRHMTNFMKSGLTL